jgi:sporulation protein YlmC with PRC-barrel domain
MQETAMSQPNPTISSSRVEGTKVYNPKGDKLGTIHDLVIDKASGQVRFAALEFGGFLGMGRDRYPLPWDQLHYDKQKDGYVVDVDKAQLARAPRYPMDEVLSYTDEYGRTVYEYYGSTWWM